VAEDRSTSLESGVTMAKRDAERSRQNILAAAEEEFSEKGFFGARVDEIAAKAQINYVNWYKNTHMDIKK
jgi:hypothetical protein